VPIKQTMLVKKRNQIRRKILPGRVLGERFDGEPVRGWRKLLAIRWNRSLIEVNMIENVLVKEVIVQLGFSLTRSFIVCIKAAGSKKLRIK
jgi:hypothetical protein